MSITIQRPEDRFVTDIGWLDSKHSFNFGPHWSPDHQGHGLLLVNNDDVVAPAPTASCTPVSPSGCRPGGASVTAR